MPFAVKSFLPSTVTEKLYDFNQSNFLCCLLRDIRNTPERPLIVHIVNSAFTESLTLTKDVVERILIDAWIKSWEDKMAASVEKFSGEYRWRFSQSNTQIIKALKQFPEVKGGICEMLSAMWIERQVNGDSLQHYLQNGTEIIDPNKIRYIAQLHYAGETLNPEAIIEQSLGSEHTRYQEKATQLWLVAKKAIFVPTTQYQIRAEDLAQKIKACARKKLELENALKENEKQQVAININSADPKEVYLQKMAMDNVLQKQWCEINRELNKTKPDLFALEVEKVLNGMEEIKAFTKPSSMSGKQFLEQVSHAIISTSTQDASSTYKLIGISWPDTKIGHAFAVSVKNAGIAFYDPNFGEFYFDNAANFAQWFSEEFAKLSGYNKINRYKICNFIGEAQNSKVAN